MANYKIVSLIDKPTTTGKAKKEVSVQAEDGVTTEKVGIWSDYPDFANLKVGDLIIGEIKVSDDGKWKNLMYPKSSSTNAQNRSGGAYKQKMIQDTMEKKEASISKFQASKEESIKMAGCQRDAVLLAIAERQPHENPMQSAPLENRVVYWMNWLLNKLPESIEPF